MISYKSSRRNFFVFSETETKTDCAEFTKKGKKVEKTLDYFAPLSLNIASIVDDKI